MNLAAASRIEFSVGFSFLETSIIVRGLDMQKGLNIALEDN